MPLPPNQYKSFLSLDLYAAADRGWRLFPLREREKTPLIKDWQTEATSELGQLESWVKQHGQCNWGVVTGIASGFFVVDIDGAEGRDTSRSLEQRGFLFTSTLEVTTGREDGGRHLYYRMPIEVDLRNDQGRKIGRHIDVRANGGYVVCPPSIHPTGNPYSYVDADARIAAAPAWLLEMLTSPTFATQTMEVRGLARIETGSRTNSLVSLAGTMHRKGAGIEAIFAALLAENVARCRPPLDAAKVREIAYDIPRRYPNKRDERSTNVRDGSPPEFSDDALALAFSEVHSDDLRFTKTWGSWSAWNGSVWKLDRTSRTQELVREQCRIKSSECSDSRIATRLASRATILAVECLAQSDGRHATSPEQWDPEPWLLNTPSGVVDLRTGRIRMAKREDMMTKTTAVSPGGDCPLFLAFLDQITEGDLELRRYIQKIFGYVVTGVTREHALFFFYGTGANGKSVLLNTISGLMGHYAGVAPIETFIASTNDRHPTELAGLQGRRVVVAVETEEGRSWAESKLKALTGGDKITARFMRQDFFEYVPQFKLIFAGNHKPGLRTVDEAMRRRFNLLPFTKVIPASKRDPKLAEKLRAEWPGILQWMIKGCLAWQAEGLLPPRVVTEATAGYFAAEDTIGRWMEECCELGSALRSPKAALYKCFARWCEDNKEFQISKKRFLEELEHRGFKSHRNGKERSLVGLRIVRM